MGSLSIWHWLIVLLIIVLVFGTKKLANVGKDLGGAVKGFKEGIREGTADEPTQRVDESKPITSNTIDVQAKEKPKS